MHWNNKKSEYLFKFLNQLEIISSLTCTYLYIKFTHSKMFNNKVRHLLDGDKENRMSSIILRKKKKKIEQLLL